jgi:hypothetical protein
MITCLTVYFSADKIGRMNTRLQTPTEHVADDCLTGGEMGALMRALDWHATPLGTCEAWPQSLKTSVSICLNSSLSFGAIGEPAAP